MSTSLRLGLLVALAGTAVASCISPPEYPDTPSIDFKELSVIRYPGQNGAVPFDTIVVTLSFRDGDGDLGLSPTDINEPYQEFIGPGRTTRNPNYYNYYIQPYVRSTPNGPFVKFVNPPPFGFEGEYNSRYPRLEPNSDKKAPLKGDLRFKLGLALGAPFQPGQEVRFEISIKDRALNESNKITTSSYVVQP
jgi:hypothetical protein